MVKIKPSASAVRSSGRLQPSCADGLNRIIRSQEQAQETSDSRRLCSLPRTHPGHCQGYVHTNGPRISASGRSSFREPAREISISPLFVLTGPRSTAPNVVSPFSRSLACSGGDRRRDRGQTAPLAPGASVTAPALWPVIPRYRARATDPLAEFGRCRLFRVSDTRSKPLNQEDSINGYPQQTRGGTQDRSRQGLRLGKRGGGHHPA